MYCCREAPDAFEGKVLRAKSAKGGSKKSRKGGRSSGWKAVLQPHHPKPVMQMWTYRGVFKEGSIKQDRNPKAPRGSQIKISTNPNSTEANFTGRMIQECVWGGGGHWPLHAKFAKSEVMVGATNSPLHAKYRVPFFYPWESYRGPDRNNFFFFRRAAELQCWTETSPPHKSNIRTSNCELQNG